jgi:rhomboid protease GluP
LEQQQIWLWHLAKTAVESERFTVIGVQEDGGSTFVHMLRPTEEGWDYASLFLYTDVLSHGTSLEDRLKKASDQLLHQSEEFQGKMVQGRFIVMLPDAESLNRIHVNPVEWPSVEPFQLRAIGVETETGRTSELPDDDWTLHLWEKAWKNPPRGESIDSIRHAMETVQRRRGAEITQPAGHIAKPWATYVLLGINTILFLLLSYYGSRTGELSFFQGSTSIQTLIDFGAKSPYHMVEGEYWRFVSPIFLHIGVMHFIFNSIALISLGALVEHIYGRARYILIYLWAGIAGNVASFLLSDSIGAGASGAIFGMLGAMIYVVLQRKTAWTQALGRDVLVILAINIVIGYFSPSIDNFAHFGGLIGGFLAAYAVSLPKLVMRPAIQGLSAAVLVGAISLGIGYGIANGENSVGYLQYASQQAIQLFEYEKAEELLERLTEISPEEVSAQFNLAILYTQRGDWKAAEERWRTVTELDPQNADAWYSLGVVTYNLGGQQEAISYVKKALELEPNHQSASRLLEKISE